MSEPQIIEIKESNPPKKPSWRSNLLILVVILVLSFLALLSGFWLGQSREDLNLSTQNSSKPGWVLVKAKDFRIEHPNTWKLEQNKDKPTGGRVFNEAGQIEFWLEAPRYYKFTLEQQARHASNTESTLEVDGRKAKLRELAYKEGGYFLIVEIPAAESKPQAIFWVATANEEQKKIALEIIPTFKTN
jgi:hypothetical protein